MTDLSPVSMWLDSFDHTSDVSNVSVTIKGTVYSGTRYTQDEQVRLYLLGKLPRCYVRSSRTAFVIDGEDWYIACYMQGYIKPEYQAYHPHGEHFVLCRWSVPDGTTIDRYELRPYNRVPTIIG